MTGDPMATGLRVHVVHYSLFHERRQHMEDQIQRHELDRWFPVNWILEHDRETLTSAMTGAAASGSLSMNSVIFKHLVAFRTAAESPGSHHLVLEDDVTLVDGFLDKLAICLDELPADWDMLFVGSGQGMPVPWWRRRTGRHIYFRGWRPTWWGGGGASRCAEAYLIAPRFARRFLDCPGAQPPYKRPIDWLMNEVGHELCTRSWWCEPALAFQGAFDSWTKNPALQDVAVSKAGASRLRDVLHRCRRSVVAGFKSSALR